MSAPTKTFPKTDMAKSGGRGANYKADDDIVLARGWIHASEDPIVGTEQTMEAYADKITDFYNKFRPPTSIPRSFESVKNRVKLISKECVKFACCHVRVQRLQPSGANGDDYISMATALYNKKEIHSWKEGPGRAFRFLPAWKILKEHEKFLASVEQVNDTKRENKEAKGVDDIVLEESEKSEEGSEGSSEEKIKLKSEKASRPLGRRKAKELEEKHRINAKKIRLAEEAIKAQHARNEALMRHNEILAFSNFPGGCETPEAVEYFKLIRCEALARMKKSVAAENITGPTNTHPSISGSETSARNNSSSSHPSNVEKLSEK